MNTKPILVRAFELARTGQFGRVKDIEKALAREGYPKTDAHMLSPALRRQLRKLCIVSRDPLAPFLASAPET